MRPRPPAKAPADYVVDELKAGRLRFAATDPDNPANFPRVLTVWRSNLLGSSGKGHEYFLRHLLGADNAVAAAECPPDSRPSEVVWRDPAPEGKLDLLVDIDFRMTSTGIYADVVLPAATWYEKHDLSSTDMHPFVHSFNPAIAPPWEARSDFDLFDDLAAEFTRLAEGHLGVAVMWWPCPCCTTAPTSAPSPGAVRSTGRPANAIRCRGGRCRVLWWWNEIIPISQTMHRALGPLVDELGATIKGVRMPIGDEVNYLRSRNGVTRGGVADGRPRIDRDDLFCEAILAMSGTTNGRLAVAGFEVLEARTGVELADLAHERAGDRITFADTVTQPRSVICSPEWSGCESEHRRYAPFTINVERLKPWHTLTGRQHFFLDHEWMAELGEMLPTYRPPLDLLATFGDQRRAELGADQLVARYLTPHSKWSIHSEYQDNLHMLNLFRGGPVIWLNDLDAREDQGGRQRLDRGLQPQRGHRGARHGDPPGPAGHRAHVPRRRPPPADAGLRVFRAARRDRQLPHRRGDETHAHDRRLRPTLLRVQLLRSAPAPSATNSPSSVAVPRRSSSDADRSAQVCMVMNLDKCIGCHTCTVTCKQTWTEPAGHGVRLLQQRRDQAGPRLSRPLRGPGTVEGRLELDRKGRLRLRGGSRLKRLASIFYNPDLPTIDDYHDPFTYDYARLITAPAGTKAPSVSARSALTGREMVPKWGTNWEDDLAGAPERALADPNIVAMAEKVKLDFESVFMFYLPRICEHCLNPSCVASCPSGAMYKREEDGIVLVDQDRCRGWRFCVSGCPYKKVYFNHRTGKAEKCTLCFPRIEAGLPTICSETCPGRLRYLGLVLYDADAVTAAAATPDPEDLYEAQLQVFLDPNDPAVAAEAEAQGIPHDWMIASAPLARLRPHRPSPRRPAPAPRVPDDAHGLVRPAPVPSGRCHRDSGLRRDEPRRHLRHDRCPTDPHRVPGEPVHGRSGRSGSRRASPPGHGPNGHAGPPTRSGSDGRSCRRGPQRGRCRGPVPSARHRPL